MVAMFLVHIKLTAQLRTVTGLNRYLRMEPTIGIEPTTCALLVIEVGFEPTPLQRIRSTLLPITPFYEVRCSTVEPRRHIVRAGRI